MRCPPLADKAGDLEPDHFSLAQDSRNHIIRLGHSSHLLKLRGKWWLIDPMFGERASPLSWAGPKRFHAPPVALADVPPIEGLVLSHDHYDHLDVSTVEALKDRVQRYFVPLGVGRRLQEWGVPAGLAFHGWREPLERVAALAQQKGIKLATPEIGEVLTLGKQRENRKWWEGLR